MKDVNLLIAIISASTSIIVVVLSQALISLRDNRISRKAEIRNIQKEHINPLRFFLGECYLRIEQILDAFEEENSKKPIENILIIQDPFELTSKDSSWFAGRGCYLISSCYYTACLFAYMERIRNKTPFLKLSDENDTRLIQMLVKVSNNFGEDLNIFYTIQMNIGREMYSEEEHNVITYRRFCELLMDENNIIWYESLVRFFLKMARNECRNKDSLVKHMKELADFLDEIVSGSSYIEWKSEYEKPNRRGE